MGLDYQEIGKNIRKYRIQKNMKQAELAEKVNVSPQHICHIEKSKSTPSLSILVSIANELDIDLNSLLGSNLSHSAIQLQTEMAEVMKSATTEQVALCVKLCGAVIGTENYD